MNKPQAELFAEDQQTAAATAAHYEVIEYRSVADAEGIKHQYEKREDAIAKAEALGKEAFGAYDEAGKWHAVSRGRDGEWRIHQTVADMVREQEARTGAPMQSYQLIDPFADTRYVNKDRAVIEAKANELKAGQYQGLTASGEWVQYVKIAENEWTDARDLKEVAEAAKALVTFEERVRAHYRHDSGKTKGSIPQEVKDAHREMGTDPNDEYDRHAWAGVERRSLDYAAAEIAAKHPQLAAVPDGDIAGKLAVARQRDESLLTADIAQKWATLDAEALRGVDGNPQRHEDIALTIAMNADRAPKYQAAMREHAPDVLRQAEQAMAADEQRIAQKETSKAADYEAATATPTMALDPRDMERLAQVRARDMEEAKAALALNRVEPAREREPATAGAGQGGNEVDSDEVISAGSTPMVPDKQVIPPDIAGRYVNVGNSYYNPRNTEVAAFVDRGNRLETKSDSELMAETLVRIAEARGWDEIKVSGTETFRREAWLEAAERGMHVRGYTPNDIDKAELAKRIHQQETNHVEAGAKQFRGRETDAVPGAGQASTGEGTKPTAPAQEAAEVLVAHGAAKYLHDPDNTPSYYVTTKDRAGKEKTVWGVDLARAMDESGAKPGDEVVLTQEGKRAVTVQAPVKDDQGRTVGTEEKLTHRNAWHIELARAVEQEGPERAAAKYPELAGAAAMAEAIDRETRGMEPAQRAAVAAKARQNMVNAIERGEIPEVKIKEEKEIVRERDAGRSGGKGLEQDNDKELER